MRLPNFRITFGPRGVIRSWATDTDDPANEARWGTVGKQRIIDTGPLTKKWMETCDDEFVAETLNIEKATIAKFPNNRPLVMPE